MGWIGVDFDGTLVTWGPGHNEDVMQIGEPILPMVERVRGWLLEGKDVRIFTARVGPGFTLADAERTGCATFHLFQERQRNLIDGFCLKVFGQTLPITCVKDMYMVDLYDDRCKQVISNTGETLEERLAAVIDGIGEAVREMPT